MHCEKKTTLFILLGVQCICEGRGEAGRRSGNRSEGEGSNGKKHADVEEGPGKVKIRQGGADRCVTERMKEGRKWKRAERGG